MDKVNKDQEKALFDELEKEALCLFQLRNALFIGVTKHPQRTYFLTDEPRYKTFPRID